MSFGPFFHFPNKSANFRPKHSVLDELLIQKPYAYLPQISLGTCWSSFSEICDIGFIVEKLATGASYPLVRAPHQDSPLTFSPSSSSSDRCCGSQQKTVGRTGVWDVCNESGRAARARRGCDLRLERPLATADAVGMEAGRDQGQRPCSCQEYKLTKYEEAFFDWTVQQDSAAIAHTARPKNSI